LGADYHFVQGQIFIHDEVAVTGTSAFVYQSPMPSYITSGATWSFEPSTTFSVAPATFTDCPYTVNNTYTNNNFIVLADASAALYLNNCSFLTTYTGLRLRTGMVLFDNKVSINTQAGVDLNPSTPLGSSYVAQANTGSGPTSVAWSPDSRFLAVVNHDGNSLQVFNSFNGSSVLTMVDAAVSTGAGSNPQSVAWSPDGRFLAVGSDGAPAAGLQVYQFNGSSAPSPVGAAAAVGIYPYCVAWSPDGRFLAVLSTAFNTLQVYQFNGSSAPFPVGAAVAVGSYPQSVVWSPDGRFLALVVTDASTLQVYRFNGSSTPSLVGAALSTGASTYPYSVAWSPDGRFLAVVNNAASATNLQIYRFNGSSVPSPVGAAASTGAAPYSAVWSPDGRFLVLINPSAETLQAYRFNATSGPTTIGAAISPSSTPRAVAWSPNGQFIAVVESGGSSNTLQVFQCNFYYTGQAAQEFTNGLLFGNKSLGSAYDANVQLFGGAAVTVNGMVKDDSA
jgi:WD40 repeat protein